MTADAVDPVVLASGSATRLALLANAGLSVEAIAPAVDETDIKKRLKSLGAGAGEVALALAERKAVAIAERRPGALVIGADQMLVCGADWYDKPDDVAQARRQLLSLQGKCHRLLTAVVVVQDDRPLWRHLAEARLTMRSFSPAFLDEYVDRAGPALLSSVGAYQLEGLGVQLFERIDGDHFTVLGLPLLALLGFLRDYGVIKR